MYTTANPAVKQGKTNDTSYIIICSPPKSSEVNGVVFVVPPSIRLLILTGVCLSSCPTMGQSGLLGAFKDMYLLLKRYLLSDMKRLEVYGDYAWQSLGKSLVKSDVILLLPPQ